MWTYKTPLKEKRPAPPERPPQPQPPHRTPVAHTAHRRSKGRLFRWLGALYLGGMLFGSLVFPRLIGPVALFLEYEADAVLQLYKEPSGVLFSSTFLAAFVQMTLAMILGLCVFGSPILAALLFGKGAWAGCFHAYLYGQRGLTALPITAGLILPPQLLTDGLLILLCGYALRCSSGLFRSTLGPQSTALRVQAPHLLRMYLVLTLLDLVSCFATVLLAQTVGRLLI